MSFDLNLINEYLEKYNEVVRIIILKTSGSAPRNSGTWMIVWENGQDRTIGGGQLEYEVTKSARDLLNSSHGQKIKKYSLGPDIGQCCGGSVEVLLEKMDIEKLGIISKEDGFFARPISTNNKSLNLSSILKKFRNKSIPIEYTFCDGWLIEPLVKEKRNLWIYGAGHVGTAIANTIDKLERFNIFCLDTSEERYPHDFPKNVERLIAVNPAELVKYAPGDTHHLILTYSHALDLEVCNQLLKQPFLSAGLIGSKTKWVRFKKRLGELGYKSEQIHRIVCPIGDPSLGKSPYEIAIGVANMLLDYDKIHASRKEALSM